MAVEIDANADLSICDREPITRLEHIQDFGFLIVMPSDWTILRASTNLESFLHITADEAVGLTLDDLANPEALHEVRNRAALIYSTGSERIYA